MMIYFIFTISTLTCFLSYFIFNHQMTPLHLAAELTRIKMIDDLVSQVAENNTTDTGVSN